MKLDEAHWIEPIARPIGAAMTHHSITRSLASGRRRGNCDEWRMFSKSTFFDIFYWQKEISKRLQLLWKICGVHKEYRPVTYTLNNKTVVDQWSLLDILIVRLVRVRRSGCIEWATKENSLNPYGNYLYEVNGLARVVRRVKEVLTF